MFDSFVGCFWRLMAEDKPILNDGVVDELFDFRQYLAQYLESLLMDSFLFLGNHFGGEDA